MYFILLRSALNISNNFKTSSTATIWTAQRQIVCNKPSLNRDLKLVPQSLVLFAAVATLLSVCCGLMSPEKVFYGCFSGPQWRSLQASLTKLWSPLEDSFDKSDNLLLQSQRLPWNRWLLSCKLSARCGSTCGAHRK
jgi:hypothetical protein